MNRELLEAEYVIAKKSAKRIAKEWGCSHSTILKYLRKFGFEIRSNLDNSHKGQLAYGMQLLNGKLQAHKIEAAVIEEIVALRANGLSYHQIAHTLNMLGIQTKNKASRWHATTVMKILRKRFFFN